MNDKINICENIKTWQGEGPNSGKRVFLLRFKECNRKNNPCYFCDSQVKMNNIINMNIDLKDIQKVLDDEQCGLLITGGEPTFNSNLEDTKKLLIKLDCDFVDIETNGYNILELLNFIHNHIDEINNVSINYSPKIFTKEELEKEIINFVVFYRQYNSFVNLLNYFEDKVKINIKIVCDDKYDFYIEFMERVIDMFGNNKDFYLMPKGVTLNEMIKNSPRVFDLAEDYKTNTTSRAHIIYGFI